MTIIKSDNHHKYLLRTLITMKIIQFTILIIMNKTIILIIMTLNQVVFLRRVILSKSILIIWLLFRILPKMVELILKIQIRKKNQRKIRGSQHLNNRLVQKVVHNKIKLTSFCKIKLKQKRMIYTYLQHNKRVKIKCYSTKIVQILIILQISLNLALVNCQIS